MDAEAKKKEDDKLDPQAKEGVGVFPDGLPFGWEKKGGKIIAVRPPMFAGKVVVLVDPKNPGTKSRPGVYKYA